MRLEGNFYKIDDIQQLQEDTYVATVTLSPEHKIYEGHFPSQAVVPGVCTLTIIRETLSKILSKEISFVRIKDCKYVSALLPQENLNITINIVITDLNKVKVVVERIDNKQIVLKLRADIQ
ncbi:MAG: hypothetical protein IJ341_06035 [Bacteroidales bacterium]|nr:hypothetical protein [Bacteroidales bacterium]